jgi:hypothetical protein
LFYLPMTDKNLLLSNFKSGKEEIESYSKYHRQGATLRDIKSIWICQRVKTCNSKVNSGRNSAIAL